MLVAPLRQKASEFFIVLGRSIIAVRGGLVPFGIFLSIASCSDFSPARVSTFPRAGEKSGRGGKKITDYNIGREGEGMDLSKIDLSKIGKCELCVLAKQVRVRMIELLEMEKDEIRATGKVDDEKYELARMYERCAESLETERDSMHRFESRKHTPTRSLQDDLDLMEEENRERFKIYYEEMIREALRIVQCDLSQSRP